MKNQKTTDDAMRSGGIETTDVNLREKTGWITVEEALGGGSSARRHVVRDELPKVDPEWLARDGFTTARFLDQASKTFSMSTHAKAVDVATGEAAPVAYAELRATLVEERAARHEASLGTAGGERATMNCGPNHGHASHRDLQETRPESSPVKQRVNEPLSR